MHLSLARRLGRGTALFARIFPFLLCCAAGESPRPLPAQEEVRALLNRLNYSGLEAFRRADVSLTLNFERRRWALRNYRRYDEKKRIALENGKSGTCLELALYVLEEIPALLPPGFTADLYLVAETSYFSPPRGVHYAVVIGNENPPEERYLLDPSFGRYELLDDADDYVLRAPFEPAELEKLALSKAGGALGQELPLSLRDSILLSVAVNAVEGKFDPDNFSVEIRSRRKYAARGFSLLKVGRKLGEIFHWSDAKRAEKILPPGELESLQARLETLRDAAAFE